MFRLKPLIVFFCMLVLVDMSFAQVSSRSRRPTTSSKKDKNSFAEHLWYGGGIGLSFSSGFAGLAGNTFSFGLSPMVGYKLNAVFSVGPRLEIQYTNGRFQQFGGAPVVRYNGFDYGGGVFARAKILPFLFAHTEFGYINQQFPVSFNSTGNKLESERQGDNKFLAGLGYTSGGSFASEIYLLYDFFNDVQTTQLPIVYRFGFTINF